MMMKQIMRVYDVKMPVEKPAGEIIVYNPTKSYKFGGLTVEIHFMSIMNIMM